MAKETVQNYIGVLPISKIQLSGSQINFRCRVSLAIFDLLNTRCFRHGNCIIRVGIYSDIEIVHNRAH